MDESDDTSTPAKRTHQSHSKQREMAKTKRDTSVTDDEPPHCSTTSSPGSKRLSKKPSKNLTNTKKSKRKNAEPPSSPSDSEVLRRKRKHSRKSEPREPSCASSDDEGENASESESEPESESESDNADSGERKHSKSRSSKREKQRAKRKRKRANQQLRWDEEALQREADEEAARVAARKAAKQLKKEKKKRTNRRRHRTVSLALPGSIIENAQTSLLKTVLAGQIARAVAVFCVDEVVVFAEDSQLDLSGQLRDGVTADPNVFLARVLQYMECPQYLRRALFPMHADLRQIGVLPPLDAPHHMRREMVLPYREGVIMDRPTRGDEGSYANAGLHKEVLLDRKLKPRTRVTIRMNTERNDTDELIYCTRNNGRVHTGTIVSPNEPVRREGTFWGYRTRLASSLSAVFTESPYPDGYDLTVGTSERGKRVGELAGDTFDQCEHLLVVFGGLGGLETCLQGDSSLTADDPSALFDLYLNTCAEQGSRTIRTEEAILISMSSLSPLL
jgi:methyltransferase